jgi:signal transduction histidine kinase
MAIAKAQANLEVAVAELDKLSALDARAISLSAHALNSFLTVSGGIVELLIPALRDHPEPQVSVWLEGLAHATDLMAHTVGQLMSNGVGIAARLQVEDLDLPRMAERACAHYRRYAKPHNIEIVLTVDAAMQPVRTDRVLVAAIFENLLSNAIKHGPRNGRIRVRVHSERSGAVLAVHDDGPGLSPTDQARLFQPGVRLEASPEGEPAGGYGLAIAKRFVDQLGGEIRCTSTLGNGTTFSVWLPDEGPAAQDADYRPR